MKIKNSLMIRLAKSISNMALVMLMLIAVAMLFAEYLIANHLFQKQLSPWIESIPQYMLPHLMDSDHFAIRSEIKYIESTGLFNNFIVADDKKEIIAFISEPSKKMLMAMLPITDPSKTIWGYYSYSPNTNYVLYLFSILGVFTIFLIVIFTLLFRKIVKKKIEREFEPFYGFIQKIQLLTKRIHCLNAFDSKEFAGDQDLSNYEESIINKSISKLINEIFISREDLRKMIIDTEQQRAHAKLTKLAIQIAHDIRSPIAALKSLINLSNDIQENECRIINQVSNRIESIANSILNDARKNNDLYMSESVLLEPLIRSVILEKRAQYANSKTSILLHDESATDAIAINVDSEKFKCVISNLINNAYESIETDKGLIDITIGLLLKNRVIVSIKDNGAGIEPEELKLLGSQKIQSKKSDGTGIGLLNARELIEEWGGLLEIQSTYGEGTTLVINLPLNGSE